MPRKTKTDAVPPMPPARKYVSRAAQGMKEDLQSKTRKRRMVTVDVNEVQRAMFLSAAEARDQVPPEIRAAVEKMTGPKPAKRKSSVVPLTALLSTDNRVEMLPRAMLDVVLQRYSDEYTLGNESADMMQFFISEELQSFGVPIDSTVFFRLYALEDTAFPLMFPGKTIVLAKTSTTTRVPHQLVDGPEFYFYVGTATDIVSSVETAPVRKADSWKPGPYPLSNALADLFYVALTKSTQLPVKMTGEVVANGEEFLSTFKATGLGRPLQASMLETTNKSEFEIAYLLEGSPRYKVGKYAVEDIYLAVLDLVNYFQSDATDRQAPIPHFALSSKMGDGAEPAPNGLSAAIRELRGKADK